MNKKNGVTSPDITWLQALASHQNFKCSQVLACDSNVGNRETLEVKEPTLSATAIQGYRLTNLWKQQGTKTNRALSSTKQQRSNTKHYKTTKIER